MNYLIQLKYFWRLHQMHQLNPPETALYFYLLECCNSCNWVNPFKRNTVKIMGDLRMIKKTLERSRQRLKQCGIIDFKAARGNANITYQLIELEALFKQGGGVACDVACDVAAGAAGNVALNKNNKPKPKQLAAVDYTAALNFFNSTHNCRLLMERHQLFPLEIDACFEVFYKSKIDLGDLAGKTAEDVARNFYYWLPKHLAARQKEKTCAKKEKGPEQRGVAAALDFANAKMWD